MKVVGPSLLAAYLIGRSFEKLTCVAQEFLLKYSAKMMTLSTRLRVRSVAISPYAFVLSNILGAARPHTCKAPRVIVNRNVHLTL